MKQDMITDITVITVMNMLKENGDTIDMEDTGMSSGIQ